ncbi:MAG: LacI family DNA-binding transcriptional regulator [Bacteroidota bacterium]
MPNTRRSGKTPHRRPTIKDVARQAGLSLSTVSLVINQSGYVSEETRSRVLRVVKELGYHPSRVARGLASKTSGNIGFILSDDHFSSAEPFYTRIFLGTEFEARNHNFYILLTTVGNQFREDSSIPRFLLEGNVDGVIIAGKISARLVEYIEGIGLPIVLVDYELPGKRLSSVLIDNRKGAHLAVEHLARLGHRRIGFIGGDMQHPSIAERYKAYLETLDDLGLPRDERLAVTDEPDTRRENGASAFRVLRARGGRPTAIFAANDAMAIGCLQVARQQGMRIPDDLAIVGFDDVESATHVDPPLTTIRVFKEEMGTLAMQRLVHAVKTKTQTIVNTYVPVELIVRASTVKQQPASPEVAGTAEGLD